MQGCPLREPLHYSILLFTIVFMSRIHTVILAAAFAVCSLPRLSAQETTEEGFSRTVLLEEFTTEMCNNCPAASVKLHNILEHPDYAGRLLAVCHHIGFLTDWLTLPEDEEYKWFFNSEKSYAPGLMIDRVPTFEETSAVFGMTLRSEEEICEEIDKRLAILSPVRLNVSAETDENGCVNVTVEGEKTPEPQKNLKITVYLVENNIEAVLQSGALDGFIHQHVTRAMNNAWGESIEWEGDNFSYQYCFDLDETWKLSDMEVVAVVNRDIPNDALKCEVVNAGAVTLGQSGVPGIASDCRMSVSYYDMHGRKLRGRPESGFYIVVHGDGTAEKVIM